MYIRFFILLIAFFPFELLAQEQEAKCSHIVDPVGKPNALTSETSSTELCHQGFILSYNYETKVSNWIMQHLKASDLIGPANRKDSRFRPDPMLEKDLQASLADYRGSGFDRGHLAPAADFSSNQSAMNESFYFSNIAQQVGIGFNRGIWKHLETKIRTWAKSRKSLVVITGPVYFDMIPTIGPRKVVVPDGFFKITFDLASFEALAFYIPNAKTQNKNLSQYQKKIREIETMTGLDFFTDLPKQKQDFLETVLFKIWD